MKKLSLYITSVLVVCSLCTSCQGNPAPTSPYSTPCATVDTINTTEDMTVDTTAPNPTTTSTAAPLTWDEVLKIAEQELAAQSEIDTYFVKYTMLEVFDPVGFALGANPSIYYCVKSEEDLDALPARFPTNIYSATVKNDLCPLSFEELCDSYDASFFEVNDIVIISIISSNNMRPTISKVTFGSGGEYVPDWVIHCEYEESVNGDKCLYQVFVELPKGDSERFIGDIGIASNGKFWP